MINGYSAKSWDHCSCLLTSYYTIFCIHWLALQAKDVYCVKVPIQKLCCGRKRRAVSSTSSYLLPFFTSQIIVSSLTWTELHNTRKLPAAVNWSHFFEHWKHMLSTQAENFGKLVRSFTAASRLLPWTRGQTFLCPDQNAPLRLRTCHGSLQLYWKPDHRFQSYRFCRTFLLSPFLLTPLALASFRNWSNSSFTLSNRTFREISPIGTLHSTSKLWTKFS